MSFLGKIRNNKFGYKIGRAILLNRVITNNSLYKKAYSSRIKKAITRLENNAPSSVEIGVTNACNSDCIMCPHSKLKKIGTMKMDLYKKIIDNCHKLNIKSVTLSFFGEPLLDPSLIEKIKYAKSKGIRVSFFSNASLLNENWARKLIESGLDNINISFDAYSKETYEKIRKGLKFDIVRNNIKRLLSLKKEMGRDNPDVNLIFVEMNENAGEIKNFYKDWKSQVDNISVLNMRNWAGEINKSSSKSFHFNSSQRAPCALIWQKMIIDWDGDVVLCCDDWSHSYPLGNLKKQTIEEVWNGERIKKVRDLHKSGKFGGVPLCAKCNKKTVWWFV